MTYDDDSRIGGATETREAWKLEGEMRRDSITNLPRLREGCCGRRAARWRVRRHRCIYPA